jgi:putative spermidine/putrescine transport system permease protein
MILGRRQAALLTLLPGLSLLVFVVLPVALSVQMSFKTWGFFTGISDAFTSANYLQVLRDPYYVKAWTNSIVICAESALVTLAVGSLTAYMLWRVGGFVRSYGTALVLAPLLVSGVVRAYGWLAIGGPTGVVPKASSAVGLGHLQLFGNQAAMVVGFVHVFMPIVVMMILASLDTIPPSIIKAGANLGAGPVAVAFRVILPNVYSTGVSAFLLVFALAMGSYAIPAILGAGKILTIAQVMFDQQTNTSNWPQAAALGISLTVVTVVVMGLYQFLLRQVGKTMSVVEV